MGRTLLSLIMLFFINYSTSATNYYVKNGGNDAANGLSNATAWATIAKVNASTFSPGDTIFFRKGDVWREMLIVPSSGTSESYIVFTSYGAGAKPLILGSEKALTWTNTIGNIWQSATSLPNPKPNTEDGDIYFINEDLSIQFGVYKTYNIDFSNLTSEYDWTWDVNNIYIYSSADPDSCFNSIETSQRTASIYLNNQQYIEINGIDMFYGQKAGVQDTYITGDLSGYILRNCEIAWIGYPNGNGDGSKVCYNESFVEFDTIHDCGRAGIAICNNGNADISNWIIQNNILYNGNHITGIEVTAGLTGTSGSINNIMIRNNLIYELADREMNAYGSNLISFKNDPVNASSVSGISIYNNIIKNPAGTGVLLQNITQSAIHNNTFYGMNQLYSLSAIYQIMYSNDCGQSILKNNIFYGNGNYNINQDISSIYISSTSEWNQIDADYNLYFSEDIRQYIVSLEGAGPYYMENWSALKSYLGWETHSPIPSDPLFFSSDDYHLQLSSPAIGAGLDIPGYITDFDCNPVSSPPCIGAYQGGGLFPGIIGSAQIICYNTVPAPLTQITAPSGGTGTYIYQWQRSPDNSTWTDIPGAILTEYFPSVLTESIYFRRTVTSDSYLPVNSAPILITVFPNIDYAQLHDDISIPQNTSANFNIDISGGSSPFTVNYTRNGLIQPTINNYSSGTDISTGVLTAGIYTYAITSVSDANGCEAESLGTSINIVVTGSMEDIPNVFTPNGDGINETWAIPAIYNYPDAVIRIYDRNGHLFIQYTGSDPDWDGRDSNGCPLESGAYMYEINFNNDEKTIIGFISLIK